MRPAATKRPAPRDGRRAGSCPEFRSWLESKSGLSERSITDVCSRVRRLDALVGLAKVQSLRDLKIALIQCEALDGLKTVRSQLKRAGELYLAFRDEGGRG